MITLMEKTLIQICSIPYPSFYAILYGKFHAVFPEDK